MRVSVVVAVVLSLAAAGWLLSGQIGDRSRDAAPRTLPATDAGTPPPAATAAAPPPARVRVEEVRAEPHEVVITVRGRTEASRAVTVRAETDGRIVEVTARRGDTVRQDAVLARLAVEERRARLAEFEARLRQRRINHDATAALAKKGLGTKEALAAAQADVDAAKAAVEQVEAEIARTRLLAPFEGQLLEGHAELGDYLRRGDSFARIIDLDPILFTGSVTERVVAWLRPGMAASATSLAGERLTGTLRYIAPSADPAARTYRIEIEAQNPGHRMRAGLTVDIAIEVASVPAHFVTPALLALADDGTIGIKTVGAGNRVRFRPVNIIEDTPDGIWLAGLPPSVTVITVGQDFVVDGQIVEPVATVGGATDAVDAGSVGRAGSGRPDPAPPPDAAPSPAAATPAPDAPAALLPPPEKDPAGVPVASRDAP